MDFLMADPTILFVALNHLNRITWSWWAVTAPIWVALPLTPICALFSVEWHEREPGQGYREALARTSAVGNSYHRRCCRPHVYDDRGGTRRLFADVDIVSREG